jgi:precorrin-6Y C5,15-methyltransferase (decarboxylating)
MVSLPRHQRKVLVVGVGDDGPAGLATAVLARVKRADVLVGGRRHLALFRDIPAERVAITGDLGRLIDRLERVLEDRRVVVLASGDPCFFGIGPLLAARLGRARVEIVPHVSSVALAFARLGIGWQDARVVSAHGRPLADAVQAALGARKLAVLTDETNTPGGVADALLAAGAEDAPAWVFEHLGGLEETEFQARLSSLPRHPFRALNVLVVPELAWHDSPSSFSPVFSTSRSGIVPSPSPDVVPPEPRSLASRSPCSGPALSTAKGQAGSSPFGPLDGTRAQGRPAGFGLPESEYAHSAGLITKPEVRAVSLSRLRLRVGGTLWDVGAGSGSLAIEAAGLTPDLSVCAVERSETQIQMLRQNVAALAADCPIQVVAGEAPQALDDLPDPDAVFVGGSGGRLVEILDTAHARIRPGGRIVANLVTVEHLVQVLEWARSRGVATDVVQVSVARGAEILGMTRLQPENPVTIVTLTP